MKSLFDELNKSIENHFHFYPHEIKDSYLLIPVFKETRKEIISHLTNTNESLLTDDLFFKRKVGEIYQISKFVFLGLGEELKFNPDVSLSAFKQFGYYISQSGPKKITILIPIYIDEAIQKWNELYKSNLNDPWNIKQSFQIQKNKKLRDSGSKKIFFDYTYEYNIEELIKTIIYAIGIGGYSTSFYKKNNQRRTGINIGFSCEIDVERLKKIIQESSAIVKMTNSFKKIATLPGNILNPEKFENFAKKFAKEYQLYFEVLKGKKLVKEGFYGLLSVGNGSKYLPRIIIVKYQPKNSSKTLLLAGKGITFDAGGISLKPPSEMHEMKYDMSGSALVLHSVALAKLNQVPYAVVGIIGIAENMPDANASRPGDVYRAWNGVTVEIQNTDAEGRLVLGDIMSYGAERFKPFVILDFATLTGACIIALGHNATAVMTNSDTLFQKIEITSKISLERVWRLPHWSVYDDQLKSDIADIRNIGGKPAGTITAMRFLAHFVPSNIPWAHFDIAGTAWLSNGSEYVKGATGWGIKFMNELFKTLSLD